MYHRSGRVDPARVKRMPEPIVLWGAGGHALVVADIVRLESRYDIRGFLDDRDPERKGTPFLGATILGGREILRDLRERGVQHLIVAFGEGHARLAAAEAAKDAGLSLGTAVHPRAIVAVGVAVGPGTVIAAGAVVNPGTRLGESVIVNTSASVDHDCDIGDGAHVCPGARLAGGVKVGRGAWIGIGASVVDDVSIGAGACIGAGAAVVRDVPDGMLAYGVPARVVRRWRPGGEPVTA